jgi:hypothetical protein
MKPTHVDNLTTGPSDDREPTPPIAFEPQVIDTQLGGIFYLINVGIALGLYGDFTQPLQPGTTLPIWDFLTLVARRLLRQRHPSDPVWQLLRTLAGRQRRHPPGAGFIPSEMWPTLNDFLAWLMPTMRNYLRDVMRVNCRVHLGDLLLERAARIDVTPVYVDVYLSLEELPIAIRMAGLDRNPGWVPSAGRHIVFHFD